jgi:hypothetical protein
VKLYEEVWPLRHRAPAAFVGQVRRLLEFVCEDRKAAGRSLFEQLRHLVTQGTLPGYFTSITDLLRVVGNMGAYATDEDLSRWDAELIDDFFRSVVEYVYVAPAKIRRMQERLRPSSDPNKPLDPTAEAAAGQRQRYAERPGRAYRRN